MNTVHHDGVVESKCTTDAPPMHRTPLLTGAFMSSSLYALILCTKEGKRWDREHTWFTVMIGVMLTLAWLALDNREASKRAFMFFVATGLPIIARSLFLQSQALDAALHRAKH